MCLKFAPAKLRADRAFISEAVRVVGTCLQYASADLEAVHVLMLEAKEPHKYGLARTRRVLRVL